MEKRQQLSREGRQAKEHVHHSECLVHFTTLFLSLYQHPPIQMITDSPHVLLHLQMNTNVCETSSNHRDSVG